MDDFPGNSNRQREEGDTPRKAATTRPAGKDAKHLDPVVKPGAAKQRKRSMFRKIQETFTGSDTKGIWEYLVLDIMVPAAKDTMADVTTSGVERLLFGEARSRSRRSRTRGSYTNYGGVTSSSSPFRDSPYETSRSRELSRSSRARHDFDEIIIPSRGDAEQVIDLMNELLNKYQSVTVSDLYDLVGISGNYTDEKWGWTDLRGSGVERVRDGYLLALPKPEPLER